MKGEESRDLIRTQTQMIDDISLYNHNGTFSSAPAHDRRERTWRKRKRLNLCLMESHTKARLKQRRLIHDGNSPRPTYKPSRHTPGHGGLWVSVN